MSEQDKTIEAEATEVVETIVPEMEDDDKFVTINRQVAYRKVQRAGGFVRTKITYFVAGAVATVGTLALISAVKNSDDVNVPEVDAID